MDKPKILFVDDEEHILSGYKRNLRAHFDVYTANSGNAGISEIHKNGPFSVVISDFKMPEMNGNQFLSHVREIAPDTVRMMLTGYADLPTTIDAVNKGNIFRLLTKPCPLENLISTINDGIKQYNLIISERELLNKTLKGSVKVLVDILSTVNPTAFSRASRFQKFVPSICNLLGISNKWELEISILLSQIGLVTLPSEILEKKYSGETLDPEQENIFNMHPSVGKKLLYNIPRLENVADAIFYQFHPYVNDNDEEKSGEELPLVSRILFVLNHYDTYTTAGLSPEEAFHKLRENESLYDPNVLIALDATIAGVYSNLKLLTVKISDLEIGVVAATDIKDKFDQVLITKGAEITDMIKMKLLNFVKLGQLDDEIKILK